MPPARADGLEPARLARVRRRRDASRRPVARLGAGVAARGEDEVDEADVRGRHADRAAIELAGESDESGRAELKAKPTLYVIPSLTLNAFATGSPGHAAIGITEGLVRKLSMKEVAAVLAHEISHIRNNDLTVMAIADIASRIVQGMSYAAVFFLELEVAVRDHLAHPNDVAAVIFFRHCKFKYRRPLAGSIVPHLPVIGFVEFNSKLRSDRIIGRTGFITLTL